jgi:tRNA threonylcarbamoyladenosine biosynthesis protein TsaB
LAQCYGGKISRIDADAIPNAAAMLRLAQPVFAAGLGVDAAAAAPLYVRDKVALKSSER